MEMPEESDDSIMNESFDVSHSEVFASVLVEEESICKEEINDNVVSEMHKK